MRQILYCSIGTAADAHAVDVDGILESSRHNNAIDGISGLLWTDGKRFLQVIEGEDESVAQCYARISADTRHHAIEKLVDRSITKREFGYWAMAHRRADAPADEHDWRVRRMLESASDTISAPFLALVSERKAA